MENSNQFGLLKDLSRILNRTELSDLWFNTKEVKLDGFKFIRCRFDNCTLVVASTNFELENCYIDATTTIQYLGDTIKPVRLFNSRHSWIYESMPYFAPTKNSDGTLTIKA